MLKVMRKIQKNWINLDTELENDSNLATYNRKIDTQMIQCFPLRFCDKI